MVAEFAYGITAFLRGLGVEAVVIACNTASASALPELCGHFAIPIWGVIEPGVEAAARLTRSGRVGVIGTKGTIASGHTSGVWNSAGSPCGRAPAPCWSTSWRKG